MTTPMIRLPLIVAFFRSFSVSSLAEAEEYYRIILHDDFKGVPGVNITSACFPELSLELDAFRLTAPREHGNLWLFEKPNGGAFLTSGLHCQRPGVAFSEFLKSRRLSEKVHSFLVEWRVMVGAFFALSCLYLRSEPSANVIGSSEQAMELN